MLGLHGHVRDHLDEWKQFYLSGKYNKIKIRFGS